MQIEFNMKIGLMIFNQDLVKSRKINSIDNIKNSDFYQFLYSDLIQRLEPIDKTYKKGLVLGFGNYHMFLINNPSNLNYTELDQLVLIEKKSLN